MSEPNAHDLAAAHHELNQSLALMRSGHPGRPAAMQALTDLAVAISFHAKLGVPGDLFKQQSEHPAGFDFKLLSEDVTNHCMSGPHKHGDGRQCYYHSRLDTWVFAGRKGRMVLECLRGYHVDGAEEVRDWELFQFGVETRSSSISPPYAHQDGRTCALDGRLGMWLFEPEGHLYMKRCLRSHNGE